MKRRIGFSLFFVGASALGAWALWQAQSGQPVSPPAVLLPNFSIADLTSIEVEGTGNWTESITHRHGTWMLHRKSEKWILQREVMDNFARNLILAPLPSGDSMPPGPAAQYGLEPAALRLEVHGKDGETPVLQVGDPIPGGKGYYIRQSSISPVQWVPVDFGPFKARQLAELDDPRALYCDPSLVKVFAVSDLASLTAVKLTLARQEGDVDDTWVIYSAGGGKVAPPQFGSTERVTAYLTAWHNLLGKKLPSSTPQHPPIFRLEFATENGVAATEIDVSHGDQSGVYWLRRKDSDETFSCRFPPEVLKPVLSDFAETHLLRIDQTKVTRFTCTLGKRVVQAEQHDDHWIFFQPDSLNADADTVKTLVSGFFEELLALRYSDCLQENKLPPVSSDLGHLALLDDKGKILLDLRVLPRVAGKARVAIGDKVYVMKTDPLLEWQRLFPKATSSPEPKP